MLRTVGRRRWLSSSAPVPLAYHELATMKDDEFATQRGRRAPLVVLHGLLGSKSNFRSVMQRPELARNRRIVLADLRNHGDSPHAGCMSLQYV